MGSIIISRKKYLELYRSMYYTKKLEEIVWDERMKKPPLESKSASIVVVSWWEWAIGAAVAAALDPAVDYLVPAHRTTAALVNFFQRNGKNFARPYFQNHFGSRDAPNHGEVLLIYFSFPELHIFPFHSDMGGNSPAAGGIGLALKRIYQMSKEAEKKQGVVALFFGEGASNQGVVHEALRFIGTNDLPVLTVVNKNNWSTFTPYEEEASVADLSDWASGYGLAKLQIQPGYDALDIYRRVYELVERARKEAHREKTPYDKRAGALIVIEAERGAPHNVQMDIRHSFRTYDHYQPYVENIGRDPVIFMRQQVLKIPKLKAAQAQSDVRKIFSLHGEDMEFSEHDILSLEEKVNREIHETLSEVLAEPKVDKTVRRREPILASVLTGTHTPEDVPRVVEPLDSYWRGRGVAEEVNKKGWITKFVEAHRFVMDREFSLNDKLMAYGQDYGQGDVHGQWRCPLPDLRMLQEKYGKERIFSSILAESAQLGSAEGVAFVGLRPVVGVQYLHYAVDGFGALVSAIAPRYQLYGVASPMTIIMPSAEGISAGHHHAALHVKTFLYHTQMIKMVEPTTVRDMAGLLRSALRDNAPVIVIEGISAYENVIGVMPREDDYVIPIGQAAIRQVGSDLTVLSWGAWTTWMVVQPTIEALEKEGVSVEWIDARTLVPFDYNCVADSLKKTNRLVIVQAESLTGGIGESIVAKLATHPEHEYKWNPPRIRIVAAADGATPQAHALEYAHLPSVEKALDACHAVLDKKEVK